MTDWIDRRFYPTFRKNWDDSIFREYILRVLKPHHVILDLGAGAGIVEQMNFRGLVERVVGVDLDPRVEANPYLDAGHITDGQSLPFPDRQFDVVFADNVLEHLVEPSRVLSEVCRVLKPGGSFLAKTPNRWHYMPMVARCTPLSFHRYVNAMRGRHGSDTFPTVYEANSVGQIARLSREAGFHSVIVDHFEGRPEYLRIHPALYAIGVLYERFVNSSPLFARLRVLLIATFRKA